MKEPEITGRVYDSYGEVIFYFNNMCISSAIKTLRKIQHKVDGK